MHVERGAPLERGNFLCGVCVALAGHVASMHAACSTANAAGCTHTDRLGGEPPGEPAKGNWPKLLVRACTRVMFVLCLYFALIKACGVAVRWVVDVLPQYCGLTWACIAPADPWSARCLLAAFISLADKSTTEARNWPSPSPHLPHLTSIHLLSSRVSLLRARPSRGGPQGPML